MLVLCTLAVAAFFLFIGVLGRQHNLAVLMEVDQLWSDKLDLTNNTDHFQFWLARQSFTDRLTVYFSINLSIHLATDSYIAS